MAQRERMTAMHLDARRVSVVAVLGVLAAGCAIASGVPDPRAVGPRYDRWETVVPHRRPIVFDAVVRTLTDSGYVLAQTNSGVSAISTADRKLPAAAHLPGDAGKPLADAYPVRLSVVLTPHGSDSTRLAITGQYRLNNTPVTARSSEWHFVRGIGEAILLQLR